MEGGERPAGPLVYSGGNHETITRLLGAAGPDVIYCGDHLHADVVKCRENSLTFRNDATLQIALL